jgi:hypothetical protein
MFANLWPPARATTQPMEIRLSVLLKTQLAAARKPAPAASCLQRPSAELVRLLGGGDPPILVLGPERAQCLLERGLTPPVLRVERGRERQTLRSAVVMAAAASWWPLIVSFEAGHSAVTDFAGRDIVAEVLS